MSDQIRAGSRINDLIHVLPNPIEHLSGVVSNFVYYGYDPETSAIRFGATGVGIFPNYKIEEPSVPVTITVHTLQREMNKTPARTFSGRNHRQMTELDDRERHDENWTIDTINLAELRALLSTLSQTKTLNTSQQCSH